MKISEFAGRSLAPTASFDPASLQKYDVIFAPISLDVHGVEDKLLIVLANLGGAVVCLKPTRDVRNYYATRPERLSGCVVYETGLPPVFSQRTIIDTKRTYPVSHKVIARDFTKEPDRLRGRMPPDFHERLFQTIRAARSISNRRKLELLALIGVGLT